MNKTYIVFGMMFLMVGMVSACGAGVPAETSNQFSPWSDLDLSWGDFTEYINYGENLYLPFPFGKTLETGQIA